MPKVGKQIVELRHAKLLSGRELVKELQALYDKPRTDEEFQVDLSGRCAMELTVVQRWIRRINKSTTSSVLFLEPGTNLLMGLKMEKMHALLNKMMADLFTDESVARGDTEWVLTWADRPIGFRVIGETILRERMAEWKKENPELRMEMDSHIHDDKIDLMVAFTLREPETVSSSSSSSSSSDESEDEDSEEEEEESEEDSEESS